MIHVSATYVVRDIGSFNFWIGNILDSIARIGVPIFVMISGKLMLDEDYEFSKKKLIEHISKMIIFFLFWSGVYCLIFNVAYPIIKHKDINIMYVIGEFIKGYYHLWFVYLIIGLYLIVPLLRLWVKNENKRYIEYFIILSIIFTYIIPQIIAIGSNYSMFFAYLNDIIEKNLQLKYVGGYTTYFILGWYIHNYDIKHKKIIYFLGTLGLIVSIIGTYILSASTGKVQQMYENLSINVLFQSVAIFIFIKERFINKNDINNKLVMNIARNSLVIYAIHVLIITIIYNVLEKIKVDNAIIIIPIVFLLSFCISYIISVICSKISCLKKVV